MTSDMQHRRPSKFEMSLSNNNLDDIYKAGAGTRDPGFSVIVSFDYYDGPESGIAIYPQGDGVRFSSLGDSRSRLFRAFELTPIDGFWWPRIQALQAAAGIDPPRRILFPAEESKLFRDLREEVFSADSKGHYISIGTPDFERISASPASELELEILRKTKGPEKSFELAHKLIKMKLAEA